MIILDSFLDVMEGFSTPLKKVINFSSNKIKFLKGYIEIDVICNSAIVVKNTIINKKNRTLSLDCGAFLITFNDFKIKKKDNINALKINIISSLNDLVKTITLDLAEPSQI